MSLYNCNSCEELKETDANLFVNGLGDAECTSLANDTGLTPTDDNNDCTDLHNMNDCLVGIMQKQVDAESNCEWKPFAKKFIGNVWTVIKGIVCAICGIWENIHKLWEKVNCVYSGLLALADAISKTTGGRTFIRYYRDNSGQSQQGNQYFWNAVEDSSHVLDIYMNADVDYAGNLNADRDYVVVISCCCDIEDDISLVNLDVTFFSSGDTASMATLRKRRAQHPGYYGPEIQSLSWTVSSAVLVRKGEHVRVEGYVESAHSGSKYRLHQFALTWIPVNVTSPFDPSIIPEC